MTTPESREETPEEGVARGYAEVLAHFEAGGLSCMEYEAQGRSAECPFHNPPTTDGGSAQIRRI